MPIQKNDPKMPPAGKPRPSDQEVGLLADWVKHDVFGIDPRDPDPGRVTIRRLNRVEYRNTVRDLTGFDFKAEEEFPPEAMRGSSGSGVFIWMLLVYSAITTAIAAYLFYERTQRGSGP